MELNDYIDWDEGRDFPQDADDCEHIHVRVEQGYDADGFEREEITCRGCGEELRENRAGELEVRKARRAA